MILSTKLYLSGYLVYKVKSMSQEKKNSCYTFASIFSIYLVRFRRASYL